MLRKLRARLGALLLTMAMSVSMGAGAFAAQPQAQIGSKTYATLWQALEAVKNGQTVEVLKDISNQELTLFRDRSEAFSITIDLNGHTISESTTNSPAISILAGNTSVAPQVTIKDGVLRCTSRTSLGSPYGSGIWIESLEKTCKPVVTLQHMDISAANDAGINCIDAEARILSANITGYDDAVYAQDAGVYILSGRFLAANGTDKGKNGALVTANKGKISMTSPDAIIRPADWKAKKSALVEVTWFEDVPRYWWYYNDVYSMARRNIVSGTSCWTFEPEKSITRAEIVTLLAKASGENVSKYSGSTSFGDVAANAWYNKFIGWAAAKGVVSGYGYHTFGPNDTVTREQLAVMLLNYQQKIMKKAVVKKVTPPQFTDAARVSPWARAAVAAIAGEKIISGVAQRDGSVQLQPQANATRAQACAMLNHLLAL